MVGEASYKKVTFYQMPEQSECLGFSSATITKSYEFSGLNNTTVLQFLRSKLMTPFYLVINQNALPYMMVRQTVTHLHHRILLSNENKYLLNHAIIWVNHQAITAEWKESE